MNSLTSISSASTRICHRDDFPGSGCISILAGDRLVAVYRVGEDFLAVENRCPHQGVLLSGGTVTAGVVSCPKHHWQFDLRSGKCLTHTTKPLQRFAVFLEEDTLRLGEPLPEEPEPEGIQKALIRYGAPGWVQVMGTIEELQLTHGQPVITRTSRGEELGEFLSFAPTDSATRPAGEILRPAIADDLARHQSRLDISAEVLTACQTLLVARQLVVDVIDAEQLFDDQTVVLYYLGEPTEELGKLAVVLGENIPQKVIFQPVFDPEPQGSCSTGGGCGSGGCGCGE